MSSDLFSFRPATEVKNSLFETNCEFAEVEDLLEVCRICDKDRRSCRSCFIWQELHNRNFVIDTQTETSPPPSRPSEPSQKFFDNIVKKPLGRLSKSSELDHPYINASVDIVKKEDWRDALNPDSDGRKKKSRKKIKTSERPSKPLLTISIPPVGSTTQREVTTYLSLDKLDELDCKIITLMDEDYYQSEIARMLGKARQVISYRVKKILKTGLVRVLKVGKFHHYKPSPDLLQFARSKLSVIEEENKNTENKPLGRAEAAEPKRPDDRKQPPSLLKDVHHITATVKVNVRNDKALRLNCQSCPKFREGHNCRCRAGRYTRMNNWDFHAARYKGYEIAANNAREITVTVRGIRMLVDFTSPIPPSEQVRLKVKDTLRSLLESYFDRLYKRTGVDVVVDWDDPNVLRIKGVHLVLEENREVVESVQSALTTQTVKLNGDLADVNVDESPDDDGIPHPHVEVHVKKSLAPLDYCHDLFNGRIHEKIRQLEAVAAGGQSTQNLLDIVRSSIQKLESRIDQIEHELRKLKDELSSLILNANGSFIREVNTALQTIASLWVRLDKIESSLHEFRNTSFPELDRG